MINQISQFILDVCAQEHGHSHNEIHHEVSPFVINVGDQLLLAQSIRVAEALSSYRQCFTTRIRRMSPLYWMLRVLMQSLYCTIQPGNPKWRKKTGKTVIFRRITDWLWPEQESLKAVHPIPLYLWLKGKKAYIHCLHEEWQAKICILIFTFSHKFTGRTVNTYTCLPELATLHSGEGLNICRTGMKLLFLKIWTQLRVAFGRAARSLKKSTC